MAEAEEVSIGIYGKPMSIKEQQVREPFFISMRPFPISNEAWDSTSAPVFPVM